MKQICKRLSVIFLALTIISGSVLTTGLVVNADTYKVIFSDDFEEYENNDSGGANQDAMNANGWDVNNKSRGNYNTGSSYLVPNNKTIDIGTSLFSGASNWSNYSVEAKMTFVTDGTYSGATYAGVSGRVPSAEGGKGYDLIMMKTNPTDQGATLRLRCDGEKLQEITIDKLNNNTPFTLKLEFRDTKIFAYLNNEVMFSKETADLSVKYSKGFAGVRKVGSKGMAVEFDDFVVSEIVPGTYPTGYLYYTDFGQTNETLSLADLGIYGNKDNTITGGTYNMGAGTYGYLREVVDALYWEDYTVEADLQIVKKDTDTATKGYAGIVARSTNGKNEGYEFRMVYNNGKTHVELAKRIGSDSESYGKCEIPFDLNSYYTMTMTVHGNNILCWFNGTLVFDEEDTGDTTYATGYAGLRSTGNSSYLSVKADKFGVKQYQAPTITYPQGYYYCNDFESRMSLKNEGWLNNGTKKNGVYVLNGKTNNYLTRVEGSYNWTDYVVEADVRINDNGTVPQYGGISGRATGARVNGYELVLIKETSGNTVVRLFKRGVDSGKINNLVHKTAVTLEADKMYNLKMVFSGADITCYFDGKLVFEVTDNNPYLQGFAGIISADGTASSVYDNYVVREIQPTDFPANAVYPEGYLYYNDFSSVRNLTKEGWKESGTKKDGVYRLNGSSYNYLTNVNGSSEWTDYVVETEVVLHDNGTYPQYTAISARSNGYRDKVDDAKGYEMILMADDAENTVIRLYKRGVDSGRINDKVYKINVAVIPNEKHTMKMVVQGTTITCYFDGVKMLEVTDKDQPYMTGCAGVLSATGEAKSSFEYFAVREIGDKDIVKDSVVQKLDGDIWFYDDFKGEESMTERGWNTDQVSIYDGSASVTTRVVIDGVQGSETWSDYEVSAVVYVDKETGIYNDNTTGGAAICARTVSASTGYEFGIVTSPTASSYLRLLDRKSGENIAVDKETPITAGEHTLRMVCIGNEIYCYMDEQLAFAVQSDASQAGYAGMRASGYYTYYKEFTVRKARPVATILQSGAVSPSTGDMRMNAAIMYLATATLSLSVIGFVVTASYSRKRK